MLWVFFSNASDEPLERLFDQTAQRTATPAQSVAVLLSLTSGFFEYNKSQVAVFFFETLYRDFALFIEEIFLAARVRPNAKINQVRRAHGEGAEGRYNSSRTGGDQEHRRLFNS